MSTQLLVKIRPATEGDAPFIFNSWLRSFRDNGLARGCSNEVYFTEQHKLIERLLQTCTTIVACNPTDPSQIFGWACWQRVDGIFVLHYVYVKQTYRLMGLAKELLADAKHDWATAGLFTHWTTAAFKLHEKKNLLYHPYILTNYSSPKDLVVQPNKTAAPVVKQLIEESKAQTKSSEMSAQRDSSEV